MDVKPLCTPTVIYLKEPGLFRKQFLPSFLSEGNHKVGELQPWLKGSGHFSKCKFIYLSKRQTQCKTIITKQKTKSQKCWFVIMNETKEVNKEKVHNISYPLPISPWQKCMNLQSILCHFFLSLYKSYLVYHTKTHTHTIHFNRLIPYSFLYTITFWKLFFSN